MKRIILALAVLAGVLLPVSCRVGPRKDLASCVSVTVASCDPGQTITDPSGTVTNNCDTTVRIVEVQTYGYDAGGASVGPGREFVENIAPGQTMNWADLFEGVAVQCGARIAAANG